MKKMAYLANSFPEPAEAYVWEEVCELRNRGRKVIPCSFRRPAPGSLKPERSASETFYVFPLQARLALRASWMCISRLNLILDLLWRIIRGCEPVLRRLRTLLHTWLGAYLAAALRKKQIGHIHVHHGYFSSWAGMVAARFLGATVSMTLHGSDLLVRADYLDIKLNHCRFCITVSEFNRNHIHQRYPAIDLSKILVHRLGVDLDFWRRSPNRVFGSAFSILSVGRLHPIKNHEFLIRACCELKASGVHFRCTIIGDGEEYERLQDLIRHLRLEDKVELRGHVPREELPELYRQADVVVLTSHSEGIPQTLMEAMAMERIVLAPKITGIPELIADKQTGFLYQPDSMPDFLAKLTLIAAAGSSLDRIRHEARRHINSHFNQTRNLELWADDFLRRVEGVADKKEVAHANPVLQQVQLPLQRDRSIPV
ncbi:MAG: colanic acid biosynthesis glycosyltransferase WcaL [Acidobacteriaceae bacterium]|nr:colanic acid biosynthesis glycosyltransferase WcaL [Acidobacteriaceae bacterium]